MINKLLMIMVILFFYSCFSEPKSTNKTKTPIQTPIVNKSQYNDNENIEAKSVDNSIFNIVETKKFAYVKIRILKPILDGIKGDYEIGIKSSCYVVFEEEDFFSEIIELEHYDEDTKYKLLDKAEKNILSQNYNINQSLYGNAVTEYGFDAARHLQNANYSIKILKRDVLVFDSYAKASIDLEKYKNYVLE